jgi:hypothetical protein
MRALLLSVLLGTAVLCGPLAAGNSARAQGTQPAISRAQDVQLAQRFWRRGYWGGPWGGYYMGYPGWGYPGYYSGYYGGYWGYPGYWIW